MEMLKAQMHFPNLQNLSLYSKNADQAGRWKKLNNSINNFYETQRVTEKELKKIEGLKKDLSELLMELFPTASMSIKIYGSVHNGFGTKTSDVDLSLKLHCQLAETEYKNSKGVLEKVYELILKTDPKAKDRDEIEFRHQCKFPIVTAENWRGFEIDVSYDNFSALESTALLKEYCNWAPHVLPQLGLLVKRWIRAFEIKNTGKNSYYLSTFNWMTLVIYYLQRRNWTRMKKFRKNRERIVPYIQYEFWEDAISLKPWKYFERNPKPGSPWTTDRTPVAELFLGFLEFYIEFPFSKQVISIATPLQMGRCLHEGGDCIIIRNPFFRGACARKRLSVQEKYTYVKTLGKKKRQNSAGMVTKEFLNETINVMRSCAVDLKEYIRSGEMKNEKMRELFNVQG